LYTSDDGNASTKPIIPIEGFVKIQNAASHPKYGQRRNSLKPRLKKDHLALYFLPAFLIKSTLGRLAPLEITGFIP
jgi:hypothetical protein